MSDTPNLGLSEMPQNTFQPSVPFNESMQLLDMLVILVVQDIINDPPVTAAGDVGKRWIVGAAPTGAWVGHTNDVAFCTAAGLWAFYPARSFWRGWIVKNAGVATNTYYRFDGTNWVDDSASGALLDPGSDGKFYGRKNGAWAQANGADTTYDKTLINKLASTNVQAAIDETVSLIPSKTQSIAVAASDESTALATGAAVVTFRNPYNAPFTIDHVKASLTTAQASGTVLTVDVKVDGVSIFSTLLTFDNTEKTTETAATPAVVANTAIGADSEITVGITQIGDGTAKGLKLYFAGHL